MWQLAHWLVTATWVWFHLVGVHPPTPWQLKQLVAPTGTWFADLPGAALPLWQLAQLVAALKPEWSTFALDQLAVDLWQLSQLPLTPAWSAFDGLPTAGGKAPVWQVEQLALIETLLCSLAGAQAANPARWQVSQLAEDVAATEAYGMWLAERPSAGG